MATEQPVQPAGHIVMTLRDLVTDSPNKDPLLLKSETVKWGPIRWNQS